MSAITDPATLASLLANTQLHAQAEVENPTEAPSLPQHFNLLEWRAKRCIDILASALGLLAISPLLIMVSIAILLDSAGPLIFKQERVGLNGRKFHMFKFRTMYPDAEARLAELMKHNETNGAMFKMENDPRMTRVGRFLRKYSIDELPQLMNVILGEMSLVGPRPPIPRELENYEPWHFVRLKTLPGLTGLWQVSGRSSIKNFDDVVKLDSRYIEEWSLMLDFRILLRTIPVVLGGKDTA